MAGYTTATDFISFLTKHTDLRACQFRSAAYGHKIVRYSWGKASFLDLAMAIKPRGYFCHATALTFHGLAALGHKIIYMNVEQSPKESDAGSLTQEGIARAFSGKQRHSNLIYKYDATSVVMISGKNTSHLGVEKIHGPESEILPVTNLERTLIDIVVRPAYAGGPSQVLAAYRAAKGRVSVERLLTILKKLGHVYPYHQSIGFLMDEAGFPTKDCAKLRDLGLHFDFYLAHGMKQPRYSQEWHLFYPRELGE